MKYTLIAIATLLITSCHKPEKKQCWNCSIDHAHKETQIGNGHPGQNSFSHEIMVKCELTQTDIKLEMEAGNKTTTTEKNGMRIEETDKMSCTVE